MIEIDPADNQIRVEHAQEIIDEAYSSPIEGDRKAIIVFEAERLNEAAANKLLKTLEEPPASVLLVLVTAGADQLLPTIRSRCQRVDFANLAAGTIAEVLTEAGVAPERADLVARLAGGRLDRARALDGRLAGVRDAFVSTAAALDGSGSAVAAHVASVQAAMQDAMTELDTAQAEEVASLTAELEQAGYPDRVARTQLRRLGDQQKRAHRHARTELLLEGITALETVYRDALAGPSAPTLNVDRPLIVADARAVRRGARRVPRRAPGADRAQPQRDAAPRASPVAPPRRGLNNDGRRDQRGAGTLARRAGVAQMAEQRTRNAQAKGSSPFSGSTFMGRSGESGIPRFALLRSDSLVAFAPDLQGRRSARIWGRLRPARGRGGVTMDRHDRIEEQLAAGAVCSRGCRRRS